MRIYTRTGDDGTTGLLGGTRIPKSSPRIAAYGAVDEVNASIGVALAESDGVGELRDVLARVQSELFTLGADLSNPNLGDGTTRIAGSMVKALEADIDSLEAGLEPLANFVLPGGTKLAAAIHMARTVVRRAEANAVRLGQGEEINVDCIRYLNRLSDLLFVAARAANKHGGISETVWRSGL